MESWGHGALPAQMLTNVGESIQSIQPTCSILRAYMGRLGDHPPVPQAVRVLLQDTLMGMTPVLPPRASSYCPS